MKIVEYSTAFTSALGTALAQSSVGAELLRTPSFVEHYFLGNGSARLNLLMSDQGEVCATLGSERVRVEIAGEPLEVSILSNTFAFQPGAFPLLMMQWMRGCSTGMVFPGNALLLDMVAGQKRWTGVPGLRIHWLNWSHPSHRGDSLLKRLAKPLLRRLTRIDAIALGRRVAADTNGRLVLEEVDKVDDEMAACRGPFTLRLAETAPYYNWRFSTHLPYVKYRVFKIVRAGKVSGFVILADWKKSVVVAHCDGFDVEDVALAVLQSIAIVNDGAHRFRKVLLSTMHNRMQSIYQAYGFRPEPKETPFFIARFKGEALPAAYPEGLVNLDFWDGGVTVGLVYRP